MPGIDWNSIANRLERRLGQIGLEILNVFRVYPGEINSDSDREIQNLAIMVASSGGNFWRHFCKSEEYDDGKSDPMDRWCKRQLDSVSLEFGAKVKYPFERPYLPFQKWAIRGGVGNLVDGQAGSIASSPLGILMHSTYGLWFGLRGVLLFEVNAENQGLENLIQAPVAGENTCEKCLTKPCLSACPVTAFDENGLDVVSCFSHLAKVEKSSTSPNCMIAGCAARSACPVGVEYQYSPAQIRFHMNSYYN